jgi:hypothetical protein
LRAAHSRREARRQDRQLADDIIYQKRFGARLSGTAWYDGAYDGNSKTNPALSPLYTPSYIGRKYSSYTDR